MPPSVGRIVHYRPAAPGAAVRPAIILKVHNDTCVNLDVFWGSEPITEGDSQGRHPTSVLFSETEPRSWFWPPKV
jgi:hypothetical protein